MLFIKKMLKCFNHEIWRVCKHCKFEYDARRSEYCDTCGTCNKID